MVDESIVRNQPMGRARGLRKVVESAIPLAPLSLSDTPSPSPLSPCAALVAHPTIPLS